VIGVLELRLAVDATIDPDVPRFPSFGQANRLGNGNRRDHREQAADSVARAEAAQDDGRQDQGDDACGGEEKGSHGGIIGRFARGAGDARGPGIEGPGGTYPTRGP
jgi:hypothetical protein